MSEKRAIDLEIVRFAARQHDVITTAQLHALGLDDRAVHHRSNVGRLFAVHRGVHAVGRPRLTRRGVWMAAVLACGDGAALSHRSAGALHDLIRNDRAATDVAVPGGGGRRARAAIRIHRVAIEPWETTRVDGIPVTTVARTLMDIAANLQRQRIDRLLTRAERLRVYDDRHVRAVLGAHPRAPGAARLMAALAAYVEPPASDSELELAMRALCRDADLPMPDHPALVEGERVDFAWPAQRLVVETDGRETHLTTQAFEADRARDAKLTALGWRVVRFTYLQLTQQPVWVAATLARLLT